MSFLALEYYCSRLAMRAVFSLVIILTQCRIGLCNNTHIEGISMSTTLLPYSSTYQLQASPILKHICFHPTLSVCVPTEYAFCIRAGSCITHESINNGSVTRIAAGLCPYRFHNASWCSSPLQGYYKVPSDISLLELTNRTCSPFNREGLLCSRCRPGYGPAVYAYSLECVKCDNTYTGWVKYFALVSFFNTAFFLFVIIFNIRATSPPFTAYVLFCQTFSILERIYVPMTTKMVAYTQFSFLLHTVRLLSGVWNLDFFRQLIPPFCVSSNLNNLQALSLEYVHVVYPLMLITLTYIGIELHSNNKL